MATDGMACPGCFASVKGRQTEYQNTLTKAKEYAKEKQISVAICEESGEYRFYAYDFARQSGFIIREVVSEHA